MSTSTQHSQRPYHELNVRTSDVRGAKTLATYLTQPSAPSHRASTADTSRHYGTQPESSRNDAQSQDSYGRVDGSYRRHNTSSHLPHHQPAVGVTRRYHANPTQPFERADSQNSQHSSHQRHPNLSLDTRNLTSSRPSPFTPSRPAADSPAFPASDSPSPLHADLTSLKSGLESLWNLSSKKLHTLHSTLAAQAESLRALSITNANLESSMTQQQAAVSQEIERLGAENSRLIREAREANDGRTKALREREMLSNSNARLWGDKARLEGEKRELRVKLDAETDFARLCQRELEKEKEKEKESQQDQEIRVKMEEDEDGRTNDGVAEIRVPLVHVEELIERRLQYQANEFTRAAEELYVKLAQSQTRVTELEAQFKRYSVGANTAGAAPPAPPHPNSCRAENKQEKTPPVVTPVTPHTALPSSVSDNDREYPFVKTWNGKKIPESTSRLSAVNVKHGEDRPTPPVGTREFHVIQRTASGPVESRSVDREMSLKRISVPTRSTRPVSYSSSPIMDPLRISKHVAPGPSSDPRGQVVSTYAGVEAGWRPAPPPSARSSQSHRSASHSRPATPDRPLKRARTADVQDAKSQGESSKSHPDVDMTSNTAGKPSVSSETMQAPEDLEHEMSADERLMFPSLSRVLVKKRDNDGWKCVLCRQERKSPTAIFAETTPIGVVTEHVKGTHKQFWKELLGEGVQNVTPGS